MGKGQGRAVVETGTYETMKRSLTGENEGRSTAPNTALMVIEYIKVATETELILNMSRTLSWLNKGAVFAR